MPISEEDKIVWWKDVIDVMPISEEDKIVWWKDVIDDRVYVKVMSTYNEVKLKV